MRISIFILFFAGFSVADTTAFWNSILYDPINFKAIDSGEAKTHWENYARTNWMKANLSYQTKKFNLKQICIINNTLDSLRGAAALANCDCDTVRTYKSLRESHASIAKWKFSICASGRAGRIIYRK